MAHKKLPFGPPYTSLPDKFLFWPGIGPRLPVLALICKRFMRARDENAETVKISHASLKKKLGGSNSKFTDSIGWLEAEGIISVNRTKNRANTYKVNWDSTYDPSRVRKMRGSQRKTVSSDNGKCEVVPRKIRIPRTENCIPDNGKCETINKLRNKEDLNKSLSNNASGAFAPPGETATAEKESPSFSFPIKEKQADGVQNFATTLTPYIPAPGSRPSQPDSSASDNVVGDAGNNAGYSGGPASVAKKRTSPTSECSSGDGSSTLRTAAGPARVAKIRTSGAGDKNPGAGAVPCDITPGQGSTVLEEARNTAPGALELALSQVERIFRDLLNIAPPPGYERDIEAAVTNGVSPRIIGRIVLEFAQEQRKRDNPSFVTLKWWQLHVVPKLAPGAYETPRVSDPDGKKGEKWENFLVDLVKSQNAMDSINWDDPEAHRKWVQHNQRQVSRYSPDPQGIEEGVEYLEQWLPGSSREQTMLTYIAVMAKYFVDTEDRRESAKFVRAILEFMGHWEIQPGPEVQAEILKLATPKGVILAIEEMIEKSDSDSWFTEMLALLGIPERASKALLQHKENSARYAKEKKNTEKEIRDLHTQLISYRPGLRRAEGDLEWTRKDMRWDDDREETLRRAEAKVQKLRDVMKPSEDELTAAEARLARLEEDGPPVFDWTGLNLLPDPEESAQLLCEQ